MAGVVVVPGPRAWRLAGARHPRQASQAGIPVGPGRRGLRVRKEGRPPPLGIPSLSSTVHGATVPQCHSATDKCHRQVPQ